MPASPEVPAPQGAQGRSRYRPEGASPVSPYRSETLHPSAAATLSASFMRIPPIPSSVHQRPTVSLCTPAASASPCMVIRRSASSTLTREIMGQEIAPSEGPERGLPPIWSLLFEKHQHLPKALTWIQDSTQSTPSSSYFVM